MIKYLLAGGAAAATIALAPALAQSVQPAPAPNVLIHRAPMAAKVHTRASVQQTVARHFARLDANRDGFVTKAEAAAVKAAHAGKRGDRSAMRAAGRDPGAIFNRLDTNRDGSISRAEFDARRAQRQQRIATRDANGDGRPDVRRMGGGFGAFGGRMFDMADANRDGRVTLQEATGAALQHFDMADANRDGQVTREERIEMRQKMRTERRPG
ncbi:EF-hand domain-containing protein [Sphingomonas sp.]|uniref:EF-hand domain-containing protein n=1 Tax=Sphingomonas sp. TaxID=28214 RepID=UPI00184DC158|nr:EF-hand domain-containing protein [Sphingomonas sp.]MBA3512731.1 EF-hand domain-containing protein [Sphingomonas sp.]